jgi:hypothetical protein
MQFRVESFRKRNSYLIDELLKGLPLVMSWPCATLHEDRHFEGLSLMSSDHDVGSCAALGFCDPIPLEHPTQLFRSFWGQKIAKFLLLYRYTSSRRGSRAMSTRILDFKMNRLSSR